MHFTFLILVAWIIFHAAAAGEGVSGVLGGLALIVVLFSIIILHEMGHALAARRYGVPTRDITLLPIGGVARLQRMPAEPKHELVVALAGPAVNAALAVAAALLIAAISGLSHLGLFSPNMSDPLQMFLIINLLIAGFNLLPAFPTDGGRVLRSLLALRMDYAKATNAAAHTGQAMAVLFGLLGVVAGNPFLLFVALFIWIGASSEASMVQMRSALGGISVRQAMITHYQTLHPHDLLSRAIEHILSGFQHDFPVVEDERVVGILTRKALMDALSSADEQGCVGDFMQQDFETAEPGDLLDNVFLRLREKGVQMAPVVEHDRLVGIVTPENVGEFIMVNSALRSSHNGHSDLRTRRFRLPDSARK
jgi:Zn-dependent protease